MEPGFTYSVDNADFISTLKAEFYNNPDLVNQNTAKTLYDRPIGPFNSFWKDHIDLYNFLDRVSYPRDPDYVISDSWMRYYVKDSFSGLHVDVFDSGYIQNQQTNVILIDQSEDILGGVVVIAGDSYDVDLNNPNKPGNLRERLLTRVLQKPGDAVVWNEKTVHGVSKIERGHRLVFVCTKIHIKYAGEAMVANQPSKL